MGPYAPRSSFVARLHERIQSFGLEDDVVVLTGAVSHDELVDWYARASVVVMPYRSVGRDFEGFGLVLLEAGACGAPVISSRDSPAEEIVTHGESGLLVPPGDVTALESASRQRPHLPGRAPEASQWQSGPSRGDDLGAIDGPTHRRV